MLIKYSKEFHVSTDYLLGLSNKKTLDVDGLSDEQIKIITNLITEFLKK